MKRKIYNELLKWKKPWPVTPANKQIESAVNNPLSETETEYMEEYSACLSDDHEISTSTRRIILLLK